MSQIYGLQADLEPHYHIYCADCGGRGGPAYTLRDEAVEHLERENDYLTRAKVQGHGYRLYYCERRACDPTWWEPGLRTQETVSGMAADSGAGDAAVHVAGVSGTEVGTVAVKTARDQGWCSCSCGHEFELECDGDCRGERCDKSECLCEHVWESECDQMCEDARQEQQCEDGQCNHRRCAAERCDHDGLTFDDAHVDGDGDLAFTVRCSQCDATYQHWLTPGEVFAADANEGEWELSDD